MPPTPSVPSLYLDTSVIGGYYDAEFMAHTRALWRLWQLGRFRCVISQVVVEEIEVAPERVRELMQANFASNDLANVRRESGFNAVNFLQGYPPVRIVPPTFFLHGQNEENL